VSYDLDLDALEPEAKKVKLNGRIVEVYAPKFKTILTIMKMSQGLTADGDSDQSQIIIDLRTALLPVMPALADEDMDLSMEQLMSLLNFVMTIATPADTKELTDKGYSPSTLTEKKTDPS
jgi:hypothetical protein